jgi:DMSO reductase anchor subunit
LPEEEISSAAEGFPSSQLGPAIKIIPWQGGLPLETSGASGVPHASVSIPRRVSLRTEWPLLVFTFMTASLFGALTADVAGGVGVSAPIFLATAVLGLVVSGTHLGKRRRAWRAILNVAQSWLSREVLLVGLFVASGAIYLTSPSRQSWLGWTAVALGLAALFSMDKVYQYAVRPRPTALHSSSLVLTGPLLAGVLLLNPAFMAIFGFTKGVLYCLRKWGMVRKGRAANSWASMIRLGVGLMVPVALWLLDAQAFQGLIIVGVLLGEFVDRAEFYSELDFTSPQRQLKLDLEKRINPAGGTRSSKPPARS